jgi:hypothetical protein
MCTFVPVKQVNFVPASLNLTYPAASSCLQVGGSEYYEQYSSIYSGAAPEMGSSRNRLSPPKDHHQPPPNGTQFTRFTGTKLHVLTQKALQPGGTPKPCLFLISFFVSASAAWGDSHALSAAFAPLSGGGGGGAANGEEGVMEALRTSLREMEAELGPDDPNVQELRKMLRDYQRSGS